MQGFEELKNLVISKLEGESDLSWEDICDELNLDLNPHELRKRSYGIKAYDDYIKTKTIDSMSNDMQKDIEDKIIELKKEKVKLNDLRTKVNKDIREQARYEDLLELLRVEIRNLNNGKPLISKFQPWFMDGASLSDKGNRSECVLALSDLHYGIDIANSWNVYNSDIAKKRMAHMVDKTVKYGKLHGCNICHILITGDLVNNNIHLTSRLSNRESIAKQTAGVSELISVAVSELAKEFHYVTLNICDGNHDRIYPNKSDNDYNDSFIHIIREFIKLRCINISNLIIQDNKHGSELIELNVCGKKIIGLHGDKIPAKSTIPRLTTMFGRVDYVIRGHVHNSSQDSFGDSKLITVSSFSGMDEYAKHLGLNSKPSQKIIILSTENNDDCIYDIDLSNLK